MGMTGLVTRLFGPPEEITACGQPPTRLYRWKILGGKRLTVYIHHSFGADWSSALNSYPRRFISVGFAESGWEDKLREVAWMVLIGRPSNSSKINTSRAA